jgi:hypothetical protein
MCSMSRDPRCWECTICTVRAPDAVFTVRTDATTDTMEPTRLVRTYHSNIPGHSPADPGTSNA